MAVVINFYNFFSPFLEGGRRKYEYNKCSKMDKNYSCFKQKYSSIASSDVQHLEKDLFSAIIHSSKSDTSFQSALEDDKFDGALGVDRLIWSSSQTLISRGIYVLPPGWRGEQSVV